MKKFKFLVTYGLKKRVYRKAFVIANIVIALLLIIVINIPSIINLFSSGDDTLDNLRMDLYNETDQAMFSDDLEDMLNTGLEEKFYFITDVDQLEVDAFWENENRDYLIHVSGTIDNPVIVLYSKHPEMDWSLMNTIELQIINYQIDNYQRPMFSTVMAPDFEDPDAGLLLSSMASVLVLPLFVLITMATQFVGVDIIEEKSTKAIETIIASVPAQMHFLSKIVASILFVIIQGVLFIVYGLLASLIASALPASATAGGTGGDAITLLTYLGDMLPNWPMILLMTLLFMIFGTFFYLIIAALFASMAVTQEDYQQFQSPLMLVMLAGFYIGIFAPMAGGDMFMKVMSFIPVFTPIVAVIAYAGGILSTFEALLAFGIIVIFVLLTLYLVSPVYKVAILSYDQTKFFQRIKDHIRKAFPKNGKQHKQT